MSKFDLICSTKLNGEIPVTKYKSQKTGLTVVIGEVEGPVVNGFFTLATETHDDDGLPHTLEHLVFLGSKKYPFKGVLDLLANRCLASGTNAWTETDHTCYTMTTAGFEGFLSLMPIYLDHILYPTLTEAGFNTEVHHVSGDGEDGGVVYCEMQGRENTGESRGMVEMLRAMYPNSGYSAETGGIMKNLRESTTIKKVRDYHAAFYRPDNLHVIITGPVNAKDVFKALQPVEESILKHGKLQPFERPWQTPVEPLQTSVNKKILYPSDEEDCGLVFVAWRGPKATEENIKLTAMMMLLNYLCDTSVSPLQREFVEIEDPFASQINGNIVENSQSMLYVQFENVPMEKIDLLFNRLLVVLKKLADGDEKFDMERMRNMIERQILQSMSSLESQPHSAITFVVIADALYGNDSKDFEMRLNNVKQLEELREKDATFWQTLLNDYMVTGKHVVIRAVPSIEEQKRSAKEEANRIEKQRQDLGPEGLRTKEEELNNATETNEIPPPNEMLTNVSIPSKDGIKFHSLAIYRTNEGNSPPGFNVDMLPVFAEAYDIHTNFVYMIASLNTDDLSPQQRPYLLLLLELLLESPVRRNGELISHEKVVAALESDTVSSGTRLGLEMNSRFSCGPFSNTASIMLQVEPQKYEIGVNWVIDLLQFTEFTPERIRVCAAKIANDVAQAKRQGNAVTSDILKAMFYKVESNVQLSSMLRQHKFLTNLLERLENSESAQKIVDELNNVRNTLLQSHNVGVHIAANWNKLSKQGVDLVGPWSRFGLGGTNRDSLKVIPDWKIMKYDGIYENLCGSIVGMGCVESAFLYQASPAIKDFNDPDLAALYLFLQYLTQLEGPLWKQIRGQGYAYGYSMTPRPNEGLLYLTLYRATNVVAAYSEAKSITEAQLQEDAIWDETQLESARSSLIFEIIERETAIGDLVVQALLSSYKKVPVTYNQVLVNRVTEVTIDDLKRVGKLYVAPLFKNNAKMAIVCHPDKAKEVAAGFSQLGFKLSVDLSLEESVLGKC